VTRTFSKIHGLAAFRVGYAIASEELVVELRKAQAPFSVSALGQVAAVASLDHVDDLAARIDLNVAGRAQIEDRLSELGIEHVPSQANFVYFKLGASTETVTDAFLDHGVILRPFNGGWVRVSVGDHHENDRFLEALGKELPRLI
jgi:histidinol-phosphate aminotransferase